MSEEEQKVVNARRYIAVDDDEFIRRIKVTFNLLGTTLPTHITLPLNAAPYKIAEEKVGTHNTVWFKFPDDEAPEGWTKIVYDITANEIGHSKDGYLSEEDWDTIFKFACESCDEEHDIYDWMSRRDTLRDSLLIYEISGNDFDKLAAPFFVMNNGAIWLKAGYRLNANVIVDGQVKAEEFFSLGWDYDYALPAFFHTENPSRINYFLAMLENIVNILVSRYELKRKR